MPIDNDTGAGAGKPRVAVVTGGSAGLGLALTTALAERGWTVITDGRDPGRLHQALAGIGPAVVTVPGDVTDPEHRSALAGAVYEAGRLDLLVHNAGTLGPTPLPRLADYDPNELPLTWRPNVGAPLALTIQLLDRLRAHRGILVSITSDAAVAHHQGWGIYGASKAALEHLTLTFGAENPAISAYAIDPGDLRTAMHQAAFPGEDISDRPLPSAVVPQILGLLDRRPESGRYRAADLAVPAGIEAP